MQEGKCKLFSRRKKQFFYPLLFAKILHNWVTMLRNSAFSISRPAFLLYVHNAQIAWEITEITIAVPCCNWFFVCTVSVLRVELNVLCFLNVARMLCAGIFKMSGIQLTLFFSKSFAAIAFLTHSVTIYSKKKKKVLIFGLCIYLTVGKLHKRSAMVHIPFNAVSL